MVAIDTVWRTLNKNNKKNSSKIENLTERRSYYYKLISILPLRNNCSQLYKKKKLYFAMKIQSHCFHSFRMSEC